MWNSREDWDASTESETSEVLEAFVPLVLHNLVVDFQDRRVEDLTIIINNVDLNSVEERNDVELLEKGSLVGSDDLALLDELNLAGDFDLVLVDLGVDLEGREEGGRFWAEVGKHWLDGDVSWGDHAWLSGGFALAVSEGLHDWLEVAVGEDETDVQLDVFDELLDLFILLFVKETVDDGFLTKAQFGLATKNTTDLGKLVGSDVVDVNDQDLGVVLEQSLELEVKLSSPLFLLFFSALSTSKCVSHYPKEMRWKVLYYVVENSATSSHL